MSDGLSVVYSISFSVTSNNGWKTCPVNWNAYIHLVYLQSLQLVASLHDFEILYITCMMPWRRGLDVVEASPLAHTMETGSCIGGQKSGRARQQPWPREREVDHEKDRQQRRWHAVPSRAGRERERAGLMRRRQHLRRDGTSVSVWGITTTCATARS